MKKILPCLIVLLMLSCSSREDRVLAKLDTVWAIDRITYENKPYNDSLLYNVISIDKNDLGPVVRLPGTINNEEEVAFAELYEADGADYMKIHSKNKVFAGAYKIDFIKDQERKLLGIRLTSDRLSIKAYKLTLDYHVEGMGW